MNSSAWASVVASCVVLGGCITPRENEVVRDSYRGHRVLLWGVDRNTGDVAGFIVGIVKPGDTLILSLPHGSVARFSWAKVGTSTLMQGEREWQEPSVVATMSYDTTSLPESLDLMSPSCMIIPAHESANKPTAIAVLVPLGTRTSPLVANMATKQFQGTRGELEDLLLSVVKAGKPQVEYIGFDEVVFVYQVLRKSERTAEWTKIMEATDARRSAIASAALAIVGSPEGLRSFHRLCLTATGDLQIHLVDLLLCSPAEQAMETIVTLLKTGEPKPGYGVDRRYLLLETFIRQYPYEKREAAMADIVRSATGFGKEQLRQYLQKRK